MCEWLDRTIKQGFEQGIKQGIEKGKLDNLLELMSEGLITPETALQKSKLSLEEFNIAVEKFALKIQDN